MSDTREAELMEACGKFWDDETAMVRESIMLAAGYDLAKALDFSQVKFSALESWARRSVARQIGELLVK